jgi:hypothetical protein
MVAWMPDGQGVVVRKFLSDTENAAEELWLVPVGSGQPRKLEVDTRYLNVSPVSVHPDGRQFAYLGGDKRFEVWVLENFISRAEGTPGAK